MHSDAIENEGAGGRPVQAALGRGQPREASAMGASGTKTQRKSSTGRSPEARTGLGTAKWLEGEGRAWGTWGWGV